MLAIKDYTHMYIIGFLYGIYQTEYWYFKQQYLIGNYIRLFGVDYVRSLAQNGSFNALFLYIQYGNLYKLWIIEPIMRYDGLK
jgi:hypothetical protein